MKIVIIGTGNTATILGRKLKASGHHIIQVYGRNEATANNLALELNAVAINQFSSLNLGVDIYLLAVSDGAIAEIVNQFGLLHKGIIVHTAGSVSKDVLSSSTHYGVFYPLQSLRKEIADSPDIPILIDASDENTFEVLDNLARTISGNVVKADDEQRMKLHLAAVFVNNFVNHLYAMAEEYCYNEKIDFKLLRPLVQETALRIETINPSKAQTGPAFRHDAATIQKHEELLRGYHSLKKFYTLFTESIWNQKREL